MTKQYNLKKIRTLLTEGFTAEELRRLCYDEPDFRSVYDKLAQDTGKATIIDRLLEYADQKLKIETLLSWVKEHNFSRYKEYEPYDSITISPTTSRSDQDKPQSAVKLDQLRGDESVSLYEIVRSWAANKRKMSLAYLDLSGADLPGIDLRGANLCATNLYKANLRRANLAKVDLRMVDLREADLRKAKIREADLSEAKLQGALLSEVDLTNSILCEANLSKANLSLADLTGADLERAKFSSADLNRAILIRTNLKTST